MADLRKQASRNALLQAGILLLSANPGASLADVARAAGVGRATLHRHFDSRGDMLRQMAEYALESTNQSLLPIWSKPISSVEMLSEMITALIPQGHLYSFLSNQWHEYKDDELQALYDTQLANLLTLVEAMKIEGAVDRRLPSQWIADSIDSLIYTAWNSVKKKQLNVDEAASLVTSTLLNGIASSSTLENTDASQIAPTEATTEATTENARQKINGEPCSAEAPP